MTTKTGQNFDYWTGTDHNLIYSVVDASGGSVNVTNASVWFLLEDEPNSGSILLLKTGGSGITVSGCTATVTISASLTAGCSLSGTYWTRLSACDTSGNADVLAVGYAEIYNSGL